jgi:hypothetical protein
MAVTINSIKHPTTILEIWQSFFIIYLNMLWCKDDISEFIA